MKAVLNHETGIACVHNGNRVEVMKLETYETMIAHQNWWKRVKSKLTSNVANRTR